MAAYYNEIDDYAAAWLRNLIRDGLIADGVVDTQSIEDVCPDDLREFEQCHFFAGVGLWSLALRLAGWRDDRRIWTGSCPCQPFSAAGKGDGFADERHLWPAFFHLITQCEPSVVCGEQVASKDGYAWLDLVQTDLEGMGYAAWPVVFPSAGVGAPHERHRTYWVALADPDYERRAETGSADARYAEIGALGGGAIGRLADPYGQGIGGRGVCGPRESEAADSGASCERPAGFRQVGGLDNARGGGFQERQREQEPTAGNHHAGTSAIGRVDDADESRSQRHAGHGRDESGRETEERPVAAAGVPSDYDRPGPTNGFWRNCDWVLCNDPAGPRWRAVEPGSFPLAYGLPRSVGTVGAGLAGLYAAAGVGKDSLDRAKQYRVGVLRGMGNAINPRQAAEFIAAWESAAP